MRVFLNTPSANTATSLEDAGYAGTVAFFGAAGGEAGHAAHAGHAAAGAGADYIIDATRAVTRLRADGRYKAGDKLTVTLVTIPIAPKEVVGVGAGPQGIKWV